MIGIKSCLDPWRIPVRHCEWIQIFLISVHLKWLLIIIFVSWHQGIRNVILIQGTKLFIKVILTSIVIFGSICVQWLIIPKLLFDLLNLFSQISIQNKIIFSNVRSLKLWRATNCRYLCQRLFPQMMLSICLNNLIFRHMLSLWCSFAGSLNIYFHIKLLAQHRIRWLIN